MNDRAPINDDDILDRLQRIDPLPIGVRVEPAHSARALTLMESIMSTDLHTRPSDSSPVADSSDAVAPTRRSTRRRWFATAGLGGVAAAAAITAALVLRGNGGLAIFTDGVATMMCLLQVVDGTPVYAGMTMFDAVASPTDTLLVEGAMTTALDSGAAVSMITGQAGPAARVEVAVPGLDPITATVVDGRFAAWWPEPAADGSTSLTGDVRIRALAADGTLLADVAWLDTAGAKGADAAPERTPQP